MDATQEIQTTQAGKALLVDAIELARQLDSKQANAEGVWG